MDMTIRPMSPEERAYSYSHEDDVMQSSGCIGHLRGDMGSDGGGFFTSWTDHDDALKSNEFKAELDAVVDALRFDPRYGHLLGTRSDLNAYCRSHADSGFDGSYTREYGFRADTDRYSYMIRCNPTRGDYNFYIYAYEKEKLEHALSPESEKIRVLVVEPEKAPYVKDISPGLESLQKEVDGYIEAVYPFEDSCAIICNEEGKLNGLPLNRALRDDDGQIYDILAGTFLVVGLSDEDFSSLSAKQIDRYSKLYRTPEMFARINGRLVVLPLEEQPAKAERPSVLDKLSSMREQESASPRKHSVEKEER